MSVSNLTLVTAACAIAGLAVVGVATMFIIEPPAIWSETREPGASIEGHWYPVNSGGCFGDAVVYRIEPDREVVISKGIALTFGAGLSSTVEDGRVIMDMEIPLRRTSPDAPRKYAPARFEYADLGPLLDMTKFEEDGKNVPVADPDSGDLKRCGNYSFWARMSLLWRPPFEPGIADEVRDPGRE